MHVTTMATISPHATVESSKLADNVIVGPFTYIGPDVRIGAGTIVENNVFIAGRTTIGRDNHIFPGAVIGGSDDDHARGKIKIGQANNLREQVVIAAGKTGTTSLGNNCLIMIACRIGPGAAVGSHVVLANRTIVSANAVLEDYARSSGLSLVEPGARVGSYSFISSYTRVDGHTPPFAMLDGNPFRVRGINTRLLQRCGFGEDDIRALKRAYRDLYNGGGRQPDPAVIERLLHDSNINLHVHQALEVITDGDKRG